MWTQRCTGSQIRDLPGLWGRRVTADFGSAFWLTAINWTVESEERNFDHLLILRDPKLVLAYQREFEQIWPMPFEGAMH